MKEDLHKEVGNVKVYLFGDIDFDETKDIEEAVVYTVEDIQRLANDDEADDYMIANRHPSYLCPETYKGRIIKAEYEEGTV